MRGKFFISLFLAGGGNCQNDTEGNGVSCYTCDTTLDSNGIVVGIGSAECFSSEIHDSFLQPCQGNATVCVNEMEVDWFFYGAQLYRMKRGCSAVAPQERKCRTLASTDDHMLKDCATGCSDIACNKDVEEVQEMFGYDQPQTVKSCLTCSFIEKDDGTVNGNKFCLEDEGHADELLKECPKYANTACYTGSNAHYDSRGSVHEEVFKGCSTFHLSDVASFACHLFDAEFDGDTHWGVCKQTCTGDNCNTGHQRPCIPDYEDCSTEAPGGNSTDPTPAPDNSSTMIALATFLFAALLL